jgi:glutamate racemase
VRIGVFDSGIGGVTVLNHLRATFAGHEFFYFGDTANVPYGTKSVAQIKELVKSAAVRIKDKNLDTLIIACNTASSLALFEFKEVLSTIPVIGVVEAGVESVLQSIRKNTEANEQVVRESARLSAKDSDAPPILILGTRATIKSKIYSSLLHDLKVYEQACPLLVPMIEEGWVDHPVLHQTIQEYVKNYRSEKPGVALLACTHYPWIKDAIASALPGWKIIDSAQAIANRLKRDFVMREHPQDPLSYAAINFSVDAPVTWFFSDPESVAPFIFDSNHTKDQQVNFF